MADCSHNKEKILVISNNVTYQILLIRRKHRQQMLLLLTLTLSLLSGVALSFNFELEIERSPENKKPSTVDHPKWLNINRKSGFEGFDLDQGSISERGLILRNSFDHRITVECIAARANKVQKDGRFEPREMKCTPATTKQDVLSTGRSSIRFKNQQPTTLIEHLRTPHGMIGGWLPFNSNLRLVPWPQPVSSYMMSYQGVFGCMIPVSSGSQCPDGQVIGPFLVQNAVGSPFFTPMPFVPTQD